MKTLVWTLLAALVALPASAASSYRSGKTAGYARGSGGSTRSAGFSTARQVSRFSRAGGFSGRGALATTGASAPASAPAPSVPGWLANPQVGALIRSAGMGFKTADAGPVHSSLDYSPGGWADQIAHNPAYAQYTTGIGVMQGPRDTPPYPANSGGGSGSGAGGNGIFTNGPVLGLNSSGQTVTVSGPGSNNGNGNGNH